jgi:hypothetical protein
MKLLQTLRDKIRTNLFLKKFFAYYIVPSGLFDRWFLAIKPNIAWIERIELVLSSSDNEKIPRVENAGTIKFGKQFMHNGLTIMLGSYYGPEVSHMLKLNKGVHEPQEEYAFQIVLEDLRTRKKKEYTMIELGSFWAFYSMWFQKELPNSKNIMVEPEKFNIGCGIHNFKQNNMTGTFVNAFVSNKKFSESSNNFVSVDSIIQDYALSYVDIVHSDIQGYEVEMLEGALNGMANQRIGYFFISTHSDTLHYQCKEILEQNGYDVLASAEQTYSFDGLLVARSKHIEGPDKIAISIRK